MGVESWQADALRFSAAMLGASCFRLDLGICRLLYRFLSFKLVLNYGSSKYSQ